MGKIMLPGLALAVLVAGVSPARAGNLDLEMLRNSGDVVEFLKNKGYKNVGVLPFKVQRGTRSPSFTGGPLAHNITRRLENALIMSMDSSDEAIGIIRDAAATASKAKVGNFLSKADEAAFKKLFATSYGLAWGGKQVKADAFLTGVVVNDDDRKTTRVTIQVIDAGSRKAGGVMARTVKTFNVKTDRALLADLGYNFSLVSARALKRGVGKDDLEDAALQEVKDEDEEGKQPQGKLQGKDHSPTNIGGFAFELHYDGASQKLEKVTQGQGASAAEYVAPPAPPGGTVNLYLTRTSDEDRNLGVVILVNGKSSWQEEDAEPIQCRKWIYAPDRKGIRDDYAGFYYDVAGNNLKPFKVLSAEESEAAASALGSKAGWIEVFVFANSEGGKDAELQVSLRGMPQSRSAKAGLKALQADLMKKNHVRVKPRKAGAMARSVGGLIVNEIEAVPGGDIQVDKRMPNPELVGHLSVKYWQPGGQQAPQGGQPQRRPQGQPQGQPQP